MAVFEYTRPAPFGAETVLKLVSGVERIMDEVRVMIHARQVYRSLKGLTPSQLSDIGLGEKDLMSSAREIARRAL